MLRDGQRGLDPASLDTGHRAAESRPTRSLGSPFPPPGSPLAAPVGRFGPLGSHTPHILPQPTADAEDQSVPVVSISVGDAEQKHRLETS